MKDGRERKGGLHWGGLHCLLFSAVTVDDGPEEGEGSNITLYGVQERVRRRSLDVAKTLGN